MAEIIPLVDPAQEEQERQIEALAERVRKTKMLAVSPDGTHTSERQNAIYYYEGRLDEVSDEDDAIPKTQGRSSVVALTLAETLETMIPVIMDIITDPETIAFRRRRGEPAEVAKRETEAAYSLIYEDNDGWQNVHDAVWDAGVGRYGAILVGNDQDDEGARKVTTDCIDAADLLYVPTATSAEMSPYWGVIFRLTRQAFYDRTGADPDDFASAPITNQQRLNYDQNQAGVIDTDNVGLIQHYLKEGSGYLCVTTDYGCTTVFDVEEYDFLPVIWFTIYKRPHSLIGWSVHDRTKGPQKVDTTLQRLAMDTAQFAQTNRPVLNKNKILPETVDQLATDAPSVPIMVNGNPSEAIGQLYQNQGLPFDLFGMLEYNAASTEARAGVGRQMQGVNAEALHDTARVGMQMENRQQMRVRTIARHIAEGPMRKLFYAVHCMARAIGAEIELPVKNAQEGQPDTETINAGQWQPLRGVTAIVDVKGGSEALQIQAGVVKGVLTDLIALQGGSPMGPFVQPQNVLSAANFIMSAAGVTNTSDYVPSQPVPQPPPAPPPPDPEMLKIEQKAQNDQANLALSAETTQAEYAFKMQELAFKREQAATEDAYKRDQAAAEMDFKRQVAAEELALKREIATAELQLQREQMVMDIAKHKADLDHDTEISSGDVRVGGDPG